MRSVSSVRTAASTRLRAASTRSSPDKVTLDQMLFQAMRGGVGGCARLFLPALLVPQCSRPRKRVQESVSLKTARDSMVSIELAAQAQMIYQKK